MVYRILDSDGNKVGVPIKASSISCKPILENLEKKFNANEMAKEALKQRTKNAIDDCLQPSPGSVKNLVAALKHKQIYTVLRQSAEGRLYGITFVDNQNKAVFNGSDLGKVFSASALQSRLATANDNIFSKDELNSDSSSPTLQKEINPQKQQDKTIVSTTKVENLIDILLSTKEQNNNVPNNLLKKKRKKKKKNRDF